ncbi:MAG: hypothetical protein ACXADL_08005 [Candidatus Thorarchaeota archaeon]|jgi:hypothetical protein
MLGKFTFKIIGVIIAGALALAAGAQLLSSVVSIVLSIRLGNPFPFVSVIIVTFVLIRLPTRYQNESIPSSLLTILSYGATGYLVVVVFVAVMPYGLHLALLGSGIAAILCSFVSNPSSIIEKIQQLSSTLPASSFLSINNAKSMGNEISYSVGISKDYRVLILPNDSRENVVDLMRNRPLLPISLTHYEDCDALIIASTKEMDSRIVNRILLLLKENGIDSVDVATPLLCEAILLAPLVDEQNGLYMSDYRIANGKNSIEHLLSIWPSRMTVFTKSSMLGIIVHDAAVPGLLAASLPSGHESEILLRRDFSSISMDGVSNASPS